MAIILEFPDTTVKARARLESLVRAALESHAPETRDKKFKAAIAVIDSHNSACALLKVPVSEPEGEPFSAAQIDCIHAALRGVEKHFVQILRSNTTEILLLKIAIIDLENPTGQA